MALILIYFRILAICFKVNKLIQSSFAITATISLITFRYSVFMPSIMNLHGYIIIAAIQQSFVSLLIVIDIGIRASKPFNYGSNLMSIIFIFVLIILTTAISYLLWYIMVYCFQNFVLTFICLCAGLQMLNALVSFTKFIAEKDY